VQTMIQHFARRLFNKQLVHIVALRTPGRKISIAP
jgi:hypothetical protein